MLQGEVQFVMPGIAGACLDSQLNSIYRLDQAFGGMTGKKVDLVSFKMAEQLIPDDLVRFVLDRIESVAQLEGLLLLRRDPQQEWSVAALAARLYISEKQTAEILSGLIIQGLVAETAGSPSRYRYHPKTPDLGQIVNRLADTYAKQLVAMTHLIHSKQRPRVQAFADAFRLRKDD